MSKVLIVKSNLEEFRVPFYSGLERRLAEEGVQLRVAAPRKCCGDRDYAWLLPVWGFNLSLAGKSICWQAVAADARAAELVIVQQSARELTNYLLLVLRRIFHFKLALWGHGAEFQRSWTTPFTESLKGRLFSGIDFWFAYTPGVAKIVERTGYPRERVCAVSNSIDTAGEVGFHRRVTEENKQALRAELGMQPGAKLICYCGSLYRAKRLDFLIEACERVRASGIDLHLGVLGVGPEEPRLERISSEVRWLHIVGPAHGERKALLLGLAECMAIPGVVGLAVVDAFAHECPLVTTDIPGHGPEIEYLVDGVNGLKVANEVDQFASSISGVLTDESLRKRLCQGCREASSKITIENMVENFASGVLTALRLPRNSAASRRIGARD